MSTGPTEPIASEAPAPEFSGSAAPEQPSSPVSGQGPSGDSLSSQTDTGSTGNPAWQPILDTVPEGLRGLVRPKLEEWDKGVQGQFQKIHEKYAPYKTLVEQKVPYERIETATRLAQFIEQDPVGFYRNMEQQLRAAGMLEEAQQAAAQAEEIAEDLDSPVDPRVTKLEQQQQEFMQALEQARLQQERVAVEKEANDAVDRELAEIESKHGPLDETLKNRLFREAFLLHAEAQQPGHRGPVPTLIDAFNSLQGFISHVKTAPAPAAPRVVPPGGGMPLPQTKPPAQMDRTERMSAAEQIILAMRGNQ